MTYPVDKLIEYDLEIYQNLNLFGCLWDDKPLQFDHTQLSELHKFLTYIEREGYWLCGFNSIGYDDPVLHSMLTSGGDPIAAYDTSVAIIEHGTKYWDLPGNIKSVDLMKILPHRRGLKVLGVILGHHKLQELPIPFDRALTPEEIQIIREYNVNDLKITRKLRKKLQPELDLRSTLSDRYGIDMRSDGEAAIAERLLLKEAGYTKKEMKDGARTKLASKPEFRLNPPTWWDQFCELSETCLTLRPVIQVGEDIFHTDIRIENDRIPGSTLERTLYLADRYYAMGVGGLHSVDGAGAWQPDEGEVMYDIDVTSYYPNLILTQNLEPEFWHNKFLPVYRSVVERRVKAKQAGDTTTAAVLKIVANGTFGKFGDRFSALFDPEMLAHVTVYGQLGLLTLIALMSHHKHRVVSANTDGITVISRDEAGMRKVVSLWERITGLDMEYTPYAGLYQQDVNNYIAVTTDNKLKTKGRFISKPDLRHMPNALIVAKAVGEYLRDGTPPATLIREHDQLHDFLITSNVQGKWRVLFGDQPIGKIVRFYKSTRDNIPALTREPTSDEVKGNAGQIPESTNGIPVEDLPEGMPHDLDRRWYIDKANELLYTILPPKVPGMNAFAEELTQQGFQPNVVPRGSRLSRANIDYGTVDFCSLTRGQDMVIRTGKDARLLAVMKQGVTTAVYRVPDVYPSTSRDKVEKDLGIRLIYGGSVPVPPWGLEIDPVEAGYFDQHYTDSELKKARGL